MIAAQFFVITLLVAFSSSSEPQQTSKSKCQKNIFQECQAAQCECTMSHYERRDSDLQQLVNWSELEVTCTSIENLRTFAAAKKCMIYDPVEGADEAGATERREYFPLEVNEMLEQLKQNEETGGDGDEELLEHRAFTVLSLTINDDNVRDVRTNCEDDEDVKCLNNNGDNDLKYVTRLTVSGRRLKHFGRSDNPVMQLFPNIRYLTLKPTTRTHHVVLTELQYLREFRVHAQQTSVKLYCAFRGENCLSNLKGLRALTLHFDDETRSGFELYGKLRLPRIIDQLEINGNTRDAFRRRSEIALENDSDQRQDIDTVMPAETRQPHMFSNIQFEDVRVFYGAYQRAELDLNEFQLPLIKYRFKIFLLQEQLDTVLPKLYAMEIQDKLAIELDRYSGNFQAPYLDLQKKTFDEVKFSGCEYGKTLFTHRKTDERQLDMETHIVIRGFHMKLSEIVTAAKGSDNYEQIRTIRAFTHDIDVDVEPKRTLVEGKILQIYFVNVGTSSDDKVTTGLKYGTIKQNEFTMGNFDVQFIHLRNSRRPDPIFMRTMATCLLMNVGLYDKASPEKLLESNSQLSKWHTLIEQTREFPLEAYTELEIARTQSAYKYLDEYIHWRDNQNSQVTKVPLLSLQTLSENIHILAQVGHDLGDKTRHLKTIDTVKQVGDKVGESLKKSLAAIADSKIAILEAAKAKSESLGDIELRKQTDLLVEISNSQELIDHLTLKFDEFAGEVETETRNFKNGVKLAIGLAVAEAAAEAVNSILGIFSGGFNPVKALKAARQAANLRNVITKLMKVMKTIGSLLKNRKLLTTLFRKVKTAFKKMKTTLSGFFKRQKSVLKDWLLKKSTVLDQMSTNDLKKLQSFSDKIKSGLEAFDTTKDMVSNTVSFLKAERTVRIGYDPGVPTEGVTIGDKKLATVSQTIDGFKDRLAKEAINQGNKLSAVDVFKWTIAKEHVTGMMDTTLSDDVPEATNYRAALLKLITTGEARTQTSIDKATLETKFAASRHAWGLYFQEAVSAAQDIAETEIDLAKAKTESSTDEEIQELAKEARIGAELDLEWEKLAIKLEMVRVNEEYCNAFYYFHLQKCQQDIRIDPSNTLDEILTTQNMLLYQSNQKLKDLYPPPQTFTDKTIVIKKPKHCQCLRNFEDLEVNSNTDAPTREAERDEAHTLAKECLQEDHVVFPAQGSDESGAQFKSKEHEFTNRLLAKCSDNNIIQDAIDNREFTYKVDIDSSLFQYHERVRIDEVKAVLKGAKTNSGIVEMYAESTGVSEDKFKNNCFKFIGEKWVRMLSYYSKDAERVTKSSARVGRALSEEDVKTMKDALVEIKEKLKNQDIVYIDSGDVHKGFSGAFRSPTVFTTWIFKIPARRNPGLDLSGLEEIELKFSGSFLTVPDSSETYECREIDSEDVAFPDEEVEDISKDISGPTIGESNPKKKVGKIEKAAQIAFATNQTPGPQLSQPTNASVALGNQHTSNLPSDMKITPVKNPIKIKWKKKKNNNKNLNKITQVVVQSASLGSSHTTDSGSNNISSTNRPASAGTKIHSIGKNGTGKVNKAIHKIPPIPTIQTSDLQDKGIDNNVAADNAAQKVTTLKQQSNGLLEDSKDDSAKVNKEIKKTPHSSHSQTNGMRNMGSANEINAVGQNTPSLPTSNLKSSSTKNLANSATSIPMSDSSNITTTKHKGKPADLGPKFGAALIKENQNVSSENSTKSNNNNNNTNVKTNQQLILPTPAGNVNPNGNDGDDGEDTKVVPPKNLPGQLVIEKTKEQLHPASLNKVVSGVSDSNRNNMTTPTTTTTSDLNRNGTSNNNKSPSVISQQPKANNSSITSQAPPSVPVTAGNNTTRPKTTSNAAQKQNKGEDGLSLEDSHYIKLFNLEETKAWMKRVLGNSTDDFKV